MAQLNFTAYKVAAKDNKKYVIPFSQSVSKLDDKGMDYWTDRILNCRAKFFKNFPPKYFLGLQKFFANIESSAR